MKNKSKNMIISVGMLICMLCLSGCDKKKISGDYYSSYYDSSDYSQSNSSYGSSSSKSSLDDIDWSSAIDDIDWDSFLSDYSQPTETPTNYTYEDNPYFDLVERYKYKSRYGFYIIDKILGKDDKTIDVSVIAYDKNGDIFDTTGNDINVYKGQYNFIHYSLDSDEYDSITFAFTAKKNYGFGDGDINALKIVKGQIKDKKLYLTLEQTGEIGYFSKLKVLYFKDGKLVGFDSNNYLSTHAKQLTSVGSKDVAEFSNSEEFDSYECFFEP